MDAASGQRDHPYIGASCNQPRRGFFKDMIPAKFAPLLFSFFLSIIMSCVVSGVATLNAAGLSDDFTALWAAAWYKSWIVAFPTILVVAPLTRRFVARVTRG
jgi:hypothetical protein